MQCKGYSPGTQSFLKVVAEKRGAYWKEFT